MSAQSRFLLGGHRGCGCTDHEFYSFRGRQIPVENTLRSFELAFSMGASYIETDAVMSSDGVVFCMHSVIPGDHFFGGGPKMLLNRLPFREIRKHKTGRQANGEVAEMTAVNGILPEVTGVPFNINIEIKGVQGSGQQFDEGFVNKLADSVSSFHTKSILWSSFALENLLEMAERLPESSYGMLFSEKAETRALYQNFEKSRRHQFLPFDRRHIEFVLETFGCRPIYLHPESKTILPEISDLRENILGINSWSLFALPPDPGPEYPEWIFHSHITDYLDSVNSRPFAE